MSRKHFLAIIIICFITANSFSQIHYLKEAFNNIKVVGSGQILHPTSLRFDENGAGYITLKRGVVLVLDTLGNLLPTPLLDISEEVVGDSDHGLVSIALDPNFLSNGYYYLLYTVDRHHLLTFGTPAYDPTFTIEKQATIGRITRYQADPATNFQSTLPDSRKILLGKDASDLSFPILMSSHGLGTLLFGEDGTLLASCGDAGSFQAADFGSSEHTYFQQALADGILREKDNVGAFRSQMIDNLAGKIIRIHPATGEGIPSNPFYNSAQPNAPKSKVWALGLRNPFRFILQPGSGSHNPMAGQPGTLFLGDVGSGWWEELNRVESGGQNFGWPLYEGYWWGWDYWPNKVINYDAPNEQAARLNCETPFYHYQDLLVEENQEADYFFPNPCVPVEAIPKDIPQFVHQRPLISWSNVLWNQPTRAMVPSFDSIGKAVSIHLEESTIQTENGEFDGFSSMPGVYYEGGTFPDEFKDQLFVSDFSGWIKTFEFDENNKLIAIREFMDRDTGLVDVEMHPTDGCMYYVHYNTHSINKICYGGSVPPIAALRINQQFGGSPLTVEFNADASYDPSNLDLQYAWNFGDGSSSEERNPTHTFTSSSDAPASFEVTLRVTNSDGLADEQSVIVSLNNTPPKVAITNPIGGSFYGSTDLNYLQLQAEVQDVEHTEEALHYNWQIFFHHNTHYHEEPPKSETSPFVIIEPTDCGTSEVFWYRFRLEVSDANGLSSFDELEVYPFCEPAFFEVANLAAMGSDKSIVLNWELAQATNVSRFDIQRTEDFRFETIGSIPANGLGAHAFEDVAPINGRNFYRIKVIRNDEAYDYSNQVSLNFPAEPEMISLYPNPTVTGRVQVFTKYPIASDLQLSIFDPMGRLVYDTQWSADLGEPLEHQLNLSFLNNGIYFYQVQNGEQLVEGRLVLMER